MERAVLDIQDIRVLWEKSGLLGIGPIVRLRLVGVVPVDALPHDRAHVGSAQPGVPDLVLDREVVLHAVRDAQVAPDGGWNTGRGRAAATRRKNGRKHHRRGGRIGKFRLADRVRTARRVGLEHHIIVENSEPGTENGIRSPGAVRHSHARREVVSVRLY